MNSFENAVTFSELKWDTDYFGITSAKAILHSPLTLNEWNNLKTRFKDYQFISIINQNSEPVNAQMIGNDTSAFLADVNIQFEKRVFGINEIPKNVTIHQSLERNEQILEIADFQFSKFTDDSELAKRGGYNVYHRWLLNSFNKQEKFYVLSNNENGNLNGFLLHSYSDNVCVIELIAVSQKVTKSGIGTSMFRALEHEAQQQKVKKIKVGTQLRNLGAINYYHKVGCRQVGCHQVYHIWNL